jgi:hypothetical protein
VQSFRAADCGTDHCIVVAKFMERLALNKQKVHKFQMERFNFKKLNELIQSSIVSRSQIGLQQWNIWTQRWILIVVVKLLERI